MYLEVNLQENETDGTPEILDQMLHDRRYFKKPNLKISHLSGRMIRI